MPTTLERPTEGEKAALVTWVNTFPGIQKIASLGDLTDGVTLSDMLSEIDPDYTVKSLPLKPSSTQWVDSKQRLEAVYKSLIKYVHEFGDRHSEESETSPEDLSAIDFMVAEYPIDFNALAQYADATETTKLLILFLYVAVKTNPSVYVVRIQELLEPSIQATIASYIQKIDDDVKSNVHDSTTHSAKSPQDQLAWETRCAEVTEKYTAIKKRNADLISRLEHLSVSREELQELNRKLERDNEKLEALAHKDNTSYLNVLEKKLAEANEVIQTQEQQLYEAKNKKDEQHKELSAIRQTGTQETRDTIQSLRAENATLAKKANMVDHYQKKLAQQSTLEKENAKLRTHVDVLESNQEDYDKVFQENEKYKTTHKELQGLIQSQENNLFDIKATKQAIEEELRSSLQQIETLQERQRHDEKFIEHLQEEKIALQEGRPDDDVSPKVASGLGLSLEDELNQADDPGEPSLQLVVSRLRAENQLLKSKEGGKTNAELRIQLQEAQKALQAEIEKTQKMREEYALSQDQLSTVLGQISGEGTQAKSEGRTIIESANQEITRLRQTNAELTAHISSVERDLLAARTDLSAMNADEITALEELKSTNEIITSSYEQDLTLLQAEHDTLKIEHADHQAHLFRAIKDKDKLATQLRELFQQPNLHSSTENVDSQGKKSEPTTALEELKAQLAKNESTISELQRRLVLAEDPEKQKAANDHLVRNLTRENALVATAWYDLTSRLQSNHVVLQRRQDAPKSWLNKQRQLVNSGPRR